jgi:Fe-S-cluster containining protein
LSCKAGCHHCCHQQVTISEAESWLVFRRNYQLIVDHKSILLHQKKYKCSDYHYSDEYSRCIFLNEDNQCSIYSIRPLVCRSCAVPAEGNPELCKVNGSPQIYSIHYEIETIISAFWHGESVKPLPVYMLKPLPPVYMLNELNRLERK